jgi:hypothetical protein
MKNTIGHFFPDLVNQQFVVPQPGIHWYVDFTEIKISQINGKLHLLLVIDSCFNEIIKHSISHNKPLSSTNTVRRLESALNERRIPEEPEESNEPQLIIHTDRGTQFSSDVYFQFTNRFKNRFRPSMSPMASPTHNGVAERFVRTFKNFKISDPELGIQEQNIQQVLQEKFINIPINMILVRQILQKYVDVYNQEIKTKKAKKGAKQNNRIFNEGKEFLKEPMFKQSYSSHAMKEDTRRDDIQQYKLQLVDVWTEINQALPGNISFDQAKPILLAKLKTIEQKIHEQFQLSLTTDRKADELIDGQKLTMNAVGQVAVAIETLKEEVRSLQNRSKSNKTETSLKIQLRDPIYGNHYDLFMIGAGQSIQKKLKVVRTAQLRIIYTVLYFSGLRINEVKNLTKEDFILATQNAEFNIIHTKTNTCQKHVLPIVGKDAIQKLLPEIKLLFDQYGFQFLGNSKVFSDETFNTDNFIRFVNNDMSFTCRKFGVLENFKSHSFRVGYITKLLRTLPVQKVAAIIGHKDTESTMAYQRYIINKEEIQNLLKDSFQRYD